MPAASHATDKPTRTPTLGSGDARRAGREGACLLRQHRLQRFVAAGQSRVGTDRARTGLDAQRSSRTPSAAPREWRRSGRIVRDGDAGRECRAVFPSSIQADGSLLTTCGPSGEACLPGQRNAMSVFGIFFARWSPRPGDRAFSPSSTRVPLSRWSTRRGAAFCAAAADAAMPASPLTASLRP